MTHWKKNIDANFISGEDLITGLNGLKSEMLVTIIGFDDKDSFDQNKQVKKVVTGLFLQEVGGKPLPKPVVINVTNGKFLQNYFGSAEIENWLNKPVKLVAVADKRHGHVVRFNKFNPPELVLNSENFNKCKAAYDKDPNFLPTIKMKYKLSPEVEAALTGK